MPAENRVVDRHQVSAALRDPTFTMPPVPDGGPAGGIRWLRGTVARFADGAVHRRRRLLVTGLLAGVETGLLRERAAERTRAVLDDSGGRPVDVMARVARVVPVEVLASALGMPPVPVDAVAVVAGAYQPGGGDEEQADRAVGRLVTVFGGVPDEATAARIGLLVQTCDATAGLVGNAVLTTLRARADRPAGDIVAETLLRDPPVRVTRRLATETGELVVLDLAVSGLPFGAGPHECPGRDHAVALAEGVVGSVRGCRAVGFDPAGLVVVR